MDNQLNGLLVVDKPGLPDLPSALPVIGEDADPHADPRLPTSHDIVQMVRRWSGQKRIGHTGTLDPMASGVLVLCLGQATRLVEYYQGHDKQYHAAIELGAATDTYDAMGQVTEESPVPALSPEMIERALDRFRGPIMQTPPVYSALKQGGESLHRKARRGEDVSATARPVTIHRIDLLDFLPPARIVLRVVSSAGVYIRSLAHDLGNALGTHGHLAKLRREAAGAFTLADAHPLAEIEQAASKGELEQLMWPLAQQLDLPRLQLDEETIRRLGFGQHVMLIPTGTERDEWQNGMLARPWGWTITLSASHAAWAWPPSRQTARNPAWSGRPRNGSPPHEYRHHRGRHVADIMLLIDDLHTVQLETPTVLTIGNFDGIHRGHQVLIRTLLRVAERPDIQWSGGVKPRSALLTFDPHPVAILRPEIPLSLLTTPDERLRLAAGLGVEIGIRQPFTRELAALDPAEFMGVMTRHLNLVALVVGPDFALGKNRAGDLPMLRSLGVQLGYDLIVQEQVQWQGRSVHSSNVRHALANGDVAEAADLLGRPYHVTGTVVEGDKRGRQIGIPTANLNPPKEKLLPANGVYITRTHLQWGGDLLTFPSVTNLGVRPTVDGLNHRVETHLLDFSPLTLPVLPSPFEKGSDPLDRLYGVTLTTDFLTRLRNEQRFASLDALIAQIRLDIESAEHYFDQRRDVATSSVE
ncbi:MAG: riboflavin biosynthesis protein RibF [Caldilineaceae bacterium]|nr:riboflavin biosynthesis protein RibF [Caldilineaceae bacterium]